MLGNFTAFLRQETIQIPAIVPLAAAAGYAKCGSTCAIAAASAGILDLSMIYLTDRHDFYPLVTAFASWAVSQSAANYLSSSARVSINARSIRITLSC